MRFNSSHDIDVGQGAAILVDAGGAIDANGKGRVGKGGSVSLLAASTEVATDGSGRLGFGEGARFSALGNGGATILATGGAVSIGVPGTEASAASLRLQAALFNSGFAGYDIAGHNGLTVEEGTAAGATTCAALGRRRSTGSGPRAGRAGLDAIVVRGRSEQWSRVAAWRREPDTRAGHLLSTADLRVGKGPGSRSTRASRSNCPAPAT